MENSKKFSIFTIEDKSSKEKVEISFDEKNNDLTFDITEKENQVNFKISKKVIDFLEKLDHEKD